MLIEEKRRRYHFANLGLFRSLNTEWQREREMGLDYPFVLCLSLPVGNFNYRSNCRLKRYSQGQVGCYVCATMLILHKTGLVLPWFLIVYHRYVYLYIMYFGYLSCCLVPGDSREYTDNHDQKICYVHVCAVQKIRVHIHVVSYSVRRIKSWHYLGVNSENTIRWSFPILATTKTEI